MSQPSFDFDVESHDEGLPTFAVGELVEAINGALKRSFFEGVWVRGEIQGWQERANGHAYFNLVEDDGAGKATLPVAWFANSRIRLRPLLQKHRLRLGDGMKVRIHGFLDVYAPTGRLSLKMSGLDPRYTLGELALQRDEVIRRLVVSGLFDANRARPLPLVPTGIGVVTSVGSAAWHDFSHELAASGFGFVVKVVDVRVQGEWAVTMVADAIRRLGRTPGVEVIAVVRGGGARSELATFDAEAIATAIAMSPVPVLTGLGHEIDRSVADEVAHRSLKTPTACAAALVERVRDFADRTERAWAGVASCTASAVGRAETRVDGAWQRVVQASRRHVDTAAAQLQGIDGRVTLLDPQHALARGWSITRTASGALVRHPADVAAGDELVTAVAGGELRSRVER